MKLIKYNNGHTDPFATLEDFFNGAFLGTSRYPFFGEFNSPTTQEAFPVDVYSDDENYYVVAELPGIKKKEVDIKLEKNVLTILAQSSLKSKEGAESFELKRSIALEDRLDANKTQAKLENGVLTITIPLQEDTKAKSISIS